MRLFYCDESNLNDATPFLVYGGAVIKSSNALSFSHKIDELRENFEIPPDFNVKFNPRPKHLNHQQFIDFKQSLIELAIENEVKFIVSIVAHQLAKNPNIARLYEINRVSYHFDCLLNRTDDTGIVLIDRFSDPKIDHHLREKFSIGISGDRLPFSDSIRLDRIIGFHYSAIGQSHFTSLIDVILGSFRFAINAVLNKKHVKSANTIIELLKPLFLFSKSQIDLISFSYSPQEIRKKEYRNLYLEVDEFLKKNGLKPEQNI